MFPDPDVERIARSLDGDRDALTTLFRRQLASVYDFVARLVLEGRDAEDVTVATFVEAVERLPALREPDRFRPWLFAIAYERAATHLRTCDDDEAPPDAAETLAEEDDRRVWRAFMDLELSTRAALDLHARVRLADDGVAEVLGLDPSQVVRFLARMEIEVCAALPQLHDPLAAYADLGEVDPPADLDARIWDEVDRRRSPRSDAGGSGRRRAAVAAVVMAVSGLLAAYAAPRLAPEPRPVDAGGVVTESPATTLPAEPTPGPNAWIPVTPEPAPTTAGSTSPTPLAAGRDDEAGGVAAPTQSPTTSSLGNPPDMVDPDAPGTPRIEIERPEDGFVAVAEDRGERDGWAARVDVAARGSDPDGQRLEGRWYSNQQRGDLARTGVARFWLVLPDGCPGEPLVHTVTVEVTDPDGNVARDSVDIEVRCP